MSASARFLSSTTWNRLFRIALPAYWAALFIVTHTPVPDLPGVPQSDKLAHLAAYGLLAYLFWRFAEALRRPVSVWFVWKAAAVLCVYGALDEYLQSFVNRTADVVDWLCDAGGVAITLGILEWQRRRRIRLAAAGNARGLDSVEPKT